jgi:hypothetical protein
MNKIETFEQFLSTQSAHVSMWGFALNLVLAALLAFILGFLYVRYGQALSNRRMFARNFVMITMATMLIITIVKSSLALSLGLVGALSIVRFRSAIKEPEELAYLFVAIAIGLGFGADQRLITVVGFLVMAGMIWVRSRMQRAEDNHNLCLTVYSHNPKKIGLDEVVETLKKHCSAVSMKRFDETKEVLEASFLVEFDDFTRLHESKLELQRLNEHVKITFLDNKGIASWS